MFVRNVSYILLGFVLGGSLLAVGSSISALTLSERDSVISEQESALKFTGTYQPVYDDLVKVYTYESLCKGFYTIEDNGVTIKYTGFGDLADQYTYETESTTIQKDTISTTTPDKPIEPLPDTSSLDI